MKFLLFEFVSCFAPSVQSEEQSTSQRTEETRALVPLTSSEGETSPRRNRTKLCRFNSGSSTTQWKPSLSAISEDKIVFVVAGKTEQTVRSGEKVAGKTAPRTRVRYHENNDNNEYRRSSAPTVFPTFTPTAFFF